MKPYYEHGGITIYHGDCRDILPDIKADVFVTDPPYGIADTRGGKESRAREKGNYSSGFDDSDEYVRVVCGGIVSMCIVQYGRGAVSCGRDKMWHYPRPRDVGCFYQPAAVGTSFWGRPTWQPILFYGSAPNVGEQLRPLHRIVVEPSEKNGHPCPKPINAWTWVVLKATKCGDLVIDPFMGSGTTLVAAKLASRKAIGIEIEERYCEIASKRLAQEVLDFQ